MLNNLLYKILKAPYNHYSPLLEAEEIQRIREEKFDYTDSVQGYQPFTLRQSSRVRYNLITDMWTCEDGSTTTMPFGIHQIYEEIVAPMVEKLMQENRIERLKIYNHIKDQKISYLNKWHQDTDAFYRSNRAQSADLINLMQESLREYVAAFNTLTSLKKTQESMQRSKSLEAGVVVNNDDNSTETLLAFEAQAKQFEQVQNDFEDFMDRLKEDIDARAEVFGHVEYYDARLQDGHSNEVAVAASEVRTMDERRKQLTMVNPLLAKKSELPPTPQIEDLVYEHMSLNLPLIAKTALDDLEQTTPQPDQELVDQEELEQEIDDTLAVLESDELLDSEADIDLDEDEVEKDDLEEDLDDEDFDEDFEDDEDEFEETVSIFEEDEDEDDEDEISDIFAAQGITRCDLTHGNAEGMEMALKAVQTDFEGLCFVNLVDFDMVYGHRNNVEGYAAALTEFDRWLADFIPTLRENDLLIITADHGCDPATPSTDHSREYTPMLLYRKGKAGKDLGTRKTFADIAATVAQVLGVSLETPGKSFAKEILK